MKKTKRLGKNSKNQHKKWMTQLQKSKSNTELKNKGKRLNRKKIDCQILQFIDNYKICYLLKFIKIV